MAVEAPSVPFLFTVTVVTQDGEGWDQHVFLARGETAWAAWSRHGQRVAQDFLARVQQEQKRLESDEQADMSEEELALLRENRATEQIDEGFTIGGVQAISCTEYFVDNYDGVEMFGDTVFPFEDDLRRERGAVLFDGEGVARTRWRDRGPLDVRQIATVLECRGLPPSSPGLLNDPVRWTDVTVEEAVTAGDDLPRWGRESSSRFWSGTVVDSTGSVHPTWLAPDSPDYPGESRYLVRWVFAVDYVVDIDELRDAFGDQLARELDNRVDDIYEDIDAESDTLFIERQDAREALLQHLLEHQWRADTDGAGSVRRIAEIPQVREPAVAATFLPFDPRSFTTMLPAHGGQLAQVVSVLRTTITAADAAEWPPLAGFVGAAGYRVNCTIGTPDAQQWSTREGLHEQMTDRLLEAYAARALAQLEQLSANGRTITDRAPADGQMLLDLRLPSGYGQVYVAGPDEKIYLGAHGIRRTTWWQVASLERAVVVALAGHVSDHWLPRGDNPAVADLRDSWDPHVWR